MVFAELVNAGLAGAVSGLVAMAPKCLVRYYLFVNNFPVSVNKYRPLIPWTTRPSSDKLLRVPSGDLGKPDNLRHTPRSPDWLPQTSGF